MKTIEQALLDKILYIGEEVPEFFLTDKRPKFILLGSPQDLIDETTEIPEKKKHNEKESQ